MIKYFIIEEMHNQKNYNIYSVEAFEDKEKRIKALVKSQLNSFLYKMISFNVNPSVMRECIEEFIEYYELDSDFVSKIDQIMKDHQSKYEEKAKQKLEKLKSSVPSSSASAETKEK